MRIFKLCTKREKKNGSVSWPEIGVIFRNDDGKMSGYLNNNPNEHIYLFEQNKDRQQQNQQQNNNYSQPPGNGPGVQFGEEEIPFQAYPSQVSNAPGRPWEGGPGVILRSAI